MSDATETARPTAAGMYDYYLGGTAHSPADRAAAEQILQVLPEVSDTAWANRGFLQRAVRKLAVDWGVRQFVDVGAGLPTQRNTHDVLAEVASGCRVVYVDHDPVVVERSAALLADVPDVVSIQGDIRDPAGIFQHPETRRLIDPTAPLGLLMVAVLHFVPDEDDPWGLVERYVAELPSGSFLVLSHSCGDAVPERIRKVAAQIYANTPTPPTDRTKTEVERFFRGLELLPPYAGGKPEVVFSGLWDAEDLAAADSDGSRLVYVGVGRKP